MSSRSTGSDRRLGVPASLRASSEEVLDHPLQPSDLLELAATSGRRVSARRIALVDFELGAHPRQRCPQLVGRVGDESLLASDRPFEAREHLVHRDGEPGDLVVAARFGHPTVEFVDTDARDLGADPLDRPQRPTDDHPDDRSQGEDGERHDPRQRCRQFRNALVDVVARPAT